MSGQKASKKESLHKEQKNTTKTFETSMIRFKDGCGEKKEDIKGLTK